MQHLGTPPTPLPTFMKNYILLSLFWALNLSDFITVSSLSITRVSLASIWFSSTRVVMNLPCIIYQTGVPENCPHVARAPAFILCGLRARAPPHLLPVDRYLEWCWMGVWSGVFAGCRSSCLSPVCSASIHQPNLVLPWDNTPGTPLFQWWSRPCWYQPLAILLQKLAHVRQESIIAVHSVSCWWMLAACQLQGDTPRPWSAPFTQENLQGLSRDPPV